MFQDRIQREYMASSDELDRQRQQLHTEKSELEQLKNSNFPPYLKIDVGKIPTLERVNHNGQMRTASEGRRKRIEGTSEGREALMLNRRGEINSNNNELKQKLANAEEMVAREKQRVDILRVQLEELHFQNFLNEIGRNLEKRERKEGENGRVKCFITFAWRPEKGEIPSLLSKLVIVKEDLGKVGVDAELDVNKLAGDVVDLMLDGNTKIIIVQEVNVHNDSNDKQVMRMSIGSNLATSTDILLDLTDHQHYYESMVALNPKGVIPVLLNLEEDEMYGQLLDAYHTRMNLLNI